MNIDVNNLYLKLKEGKEHYDEEKHCPMILKIMADKDKGRISAFCIKVGITERSFWNWVKQHELFADCYSLGKMLAREAWENEGIEIKDRQMQLGTIDHAFEHWKFIGWSRFGISKNSRIKLNLNPDGSPLDHYKELLKQASDGDFTASEIKQLMESINVGLNTHQVFQLQKEIDQLKSDLTTMSENSNAKHTLSDKGTA
jgi:desulfoferrodoxin (superoxide reductase-like protein)